MGGMATHPNRKENCMEMNERMEQLEKRIAWTVEKRLQENENRK